MSIVDVEKIINGTPKKRLLNGYNEMKENYTETSAQEYSKTYSDETLSFLLENSDMIFSEPYYGLNYYKETIENISHCGFSMLESECEKIQSFLEKNEELMGDDQHKLYTDLKNSVSTILEDTKNTRIYANYIKENIDDRFEEKLSNMMYAYEKMDEESKDNSEIILLFESIENPIIFFTYAPYVMEAFGDMSLNKLVDAFMEKAGCPIGYDESEWKTYTESVICMNKLSHDKVYQNCINNIQPRDTRMVFEYYESTSIDALLNDFVEERVSENEVYHISPVSAVNNIFDDIYESALFAEYDTENKKEKIEACKSIIYECVLNTLVSEYQQSDDTSEAAVGYTVLKTEMTLDDAFNTINQLYNESCKYVSESDDDVTDDDINAINNDMNNQVSDGKKPIAPKPKNLANKVQFKAMDKEAQQMKKSSIRAQKGQEMKNAVRAVAKVPMNVISSIKTQIHKMDELDDERRKSYMTEPGFRKKAFRNLKLAIMYGGAADVKLSLVPVVAVSRHFSKMKDRRMRNELAREINTEIKVCDEKIADASAAGDTSEKYRLIRIKDQLDAEMVRVKVNGKYI